MKTSQQTCDQLFDTLLLLFFIDYIISAVLQVMRSRMSRFLY